MSKMKRPAGDTEEDQLRTATKAAIEWVGKFWPGVLEKLMKSTDERLLLDLGKLMLAYAYGRPREMVEHTGEVQHTYVVEAPPMAATPEEWAQAYVPPAHNTTH